MARYTSACFKKQTKPKAKVKTYIEASYWDSGRRKHCQSFFSGFQEQHQPFIPTATEEITKSDFRLKVPKKNPPTLILMSFACVTQCASTGHRGRDAPALTSIPVNRCITI